METVSYNDDFYHDRHKRTLFSAKAVLSIVQEMIPVIGSAVDVGCGVGTWLSVLEEKGIKDIQGIDGNWMNRKHLVIPLECFMSHDLSEDLRLTKMYDLAISLEVAEQLSSECTYVYCLSYKYVRHCIIFRCDSRSGRRKPH